MAGRHGGQVVSTAMASQEAVIGYEKLLLNDLGDSQLRGVQLRARCNPWTVRKTLRDLGRRRGNLEAVGYHQDFD